jgi:hypothetical protein
MMMEQFNPLAGPFEENPIGREIKAKVNQQGGGNQPPELTAQPVRRTLPVDKVNPPGKDKYGSKPGEMRIDTDSMRKPLGEPISYKKLEHLRNEYQGEAAVPKAMRKPLGEPISYKKLEHLRNEYQGEAAVPKAMRKPLGEPISYKEGTDYVPKTGTYKLHEGEAVVPKEENMKSGTDHAHAALAGKDGKPKKEIKEMTIRRLHDGKLHVKHTHHHGEHHGEEEQAMDLNQLHDHLDQHLGTPSDGEPQPAGGAAPAPMTAAPSPMPPMQE